MPQPILALEGGTRFPQEYDNWIRRPSDFEIAETRNAFRKILCLSWIRRSSKIGGANLAPPTPLIRWGCDSKGSRFKVFRFRFEILRS